MLRDRRSEYFRCAKGTVRSGSRSSDSIPRVIAPYGGSLKVLSPLASAFLLESEALFALGWRTATILHVATNTTSAAIDDIATARQHGRAATPSPHRRQATTSRPPERRTGGSRRSRSGQVGLSRSISASRSRQVDLAGSSIPAAPNRSERGRQGPAARSVERGGRSDSTP